jgi:hypothetical protein
VSFFTVNLHSFAEAERIILFGFTATLWSSKLWIYGALTALQYACCTIHKQPRRLKVHTAVPCSAKVTKHVGLGRKILYHRIRCAWRDIIVGLRRSVGQ